MFSYERAKMNTQRLPRGSFDKAFRVMEKYSSGRRGAPAKGVDRESDAGVQIPPSPFFLKRSNKKSSGKIKKLLTASCGFAKMSNALLRDSGQKKQKNIDN